MPEPIETRWIEVPTEQYADAIMAATKLGGVENLWFCSGSELAFFQEASARAKALNLPAPRIRTAIHEHVALCQALGEQMITGRPVAVCAHVELGLLNMGGALHIAYRGDYPALIMSGYPPSAYPGSVPGARDNTVFWQQQQWDQGQIIRQYVKWDHKLGVYDNPAMVVTRALQVAQTPQTGPVYLAIPREVGMTPTGGVTRFPGPDLLAPAPGPVPDPTLLREAARLLAAAERPAIVVERSGRNHAAVEVLAELAAEIGAWVASADHKMNISEASGLKASTPRGQSADLSNADVVLVIDKQVPWLPGPNAPGAEAKIIVLDMDPIQRRIALFEFPADLRLAGDSGSTLPLLLEEVRRALTSPQREAAAKRTGSIRQANARRREDAERAAIEDARLPYLSRRWAAYEVGRFIDDDTVVVNEAGEIAFIRRNKPGTMFVGGGGASLGWGAAAAVGAKVARPDLNFVCLSGDGSYNFSVPSAWQWSARQYKAPTLTAVFNNRGYSTGTTTVAQTFPEGYAMRSMDLEGGWFDPPPDYSAECAASGGFGEKVVAPDQVRPALERAWQAVTRDGVPAVLDFWLPKHVTQET